MSTPAPEPHSYLLQVETTLRELLGEPASPAKRPPGRPAVVPAAALWAGLLVCLLRGLRHQVDVWRLLAIHGLWDFPRFSVTDMAIYSRLEQTPAALMQRFFTEITALLQARFAHRPPPSACTLASFAPQILAVDHTILDPVLRKRRLLQELPPGDRCLLPGALGCVFNVRQQLWEQVTYTPDPQQDLHREIVPLVQGVARGALLLFDLGYFAFWWFDQLTHDGYYYVTRLREKVTWEVQHVFYTGGTHSAELWDGLVYLGAYRADQAAQPVRLLQITVREGSRSRTYTYLTNVLDPRQLPAWEVAELYRRRWDIEKGFDLVKTHLGLSLLWSSHAHVVLHQVYATFILAQIVLALRGEIARQAEVDPREVSLPLLLRWLPQLTAEGRDPIAEFVTHGRRAGYIRPLRTPAWSLPQPTAAEYQFPDRPIPSRKARYGSREHCQRTYVRSEQKQQKRARYWGSEAPKEP